MQNSGLTYPSEASSAGHPEKQRTGERKNILSSETDLTDQRSATLIKYFLALH